ncbi:MAG: hypothetical protein KY439_04670, partial [Actinobacteria bacterium]|nr:hypothetical protein [Actinomycetota bacterium]
MTGVALRRPGAFFGAAAALLAADLSTDPAAGTLLAGAFARGAAAFLAGAFLAGAFLAASVAFSTRPDRFLAGALATADLFRGAGAAAAFLAGA